VLKNNNLAIGKIRTSFGVKGFVKILSFSGENDHFRDLEEVILQNNTIREKKKIEQVLLHGNDLIIKFEGIHTPEAAKKYTNWEIWVPRDKVCPLKEGEYYLADLHGCTLVSTPEKGSIVYGKVKSVICDSGTSDLLEVEAAEAKEEKNKVFLVPFINRFIGKVDIANKTIELLEEWIIP
jgi:16S rRNA processing protein RimM